jgi:hypothetical protein
MLTYAKGKKRKKKKKKSNDKEKKKRRKTKRNKRKKKKTFVHPSSADALLVREDVLLNVGKQWLVLRVFGIDIALAQRRPFRIEGADSRRLEKVVEDDSHLIRPDLSRHRLQCHHLDVTEYVPYAVDDDALGKG